MKTLYFDCFSGISGDMVLGALVDLIDDPQYLICEMKKLNTGISFQMQIGETEKHGIHGKTVKVIAEENQPNRSYRDICNMIANSAFSDGVKQVAQSIFFRLAKAEAKIHHKEIDNVHFHEVGAVDSIVDIVGAAVLIDKIQPDKIMSSVLYDGQGFVECRHGVIPVPVPATMEIIRERGAALQLTNEEGEMVTPTGAAILCETAESFGKLLNGNICRTGYGCGEKVFKRPNVLRVILAECEDNDDIVKLETNLDDCSSEVLGYVMEKLFQYGARDVFYTPIYMKKNRPAYLLTVLCDSVRKEALKRIIFSETTTIGIRETAVKRTIMQRQCRTVITKWGELILKDVSYAEIEKTYPEYESAKALAEKANVPFSEIMNGWRDNLLSEKT